MLNARADVLRGSGATAANRSAAVGLLEVVKTNLGPRGTLKMLVGGAGQLKVTKDGNVLLHEMQIQHPTASMIARLSTTQDEATGDGTTSNVLFVGELMRQADRYISEGVHPRLICDGFDVARQEALAVLDKIKVAVDSSDRELLTCVARTSLRTKVHTKLADQLTAMVVDAVLTIRQPNEPIDLHMVEILHMKHRLSNESRYIKGLVLDHGARHPDMPKRLKKCHILTLNVSLEYEKSEVNAGFFYSSAEQREKLVGAERRFTDEKVRKIIDLKRQCCTPENGMNFVVLNQKGIDPPALDMLAKENIIALRRVKRRNMERLTLCCGGNAMNSVEELSPADLGYAEDVQEETLGEDKFTFVEGVAKPHSCTILIKGQNDHSIAQMKDAIRDGLRAVKNVIDDGCVVPGAGVYEVATYCHLQEFKKKVTGKARLGVEAFADAMLIVPKTLATNSGLDHQDVVLNMIQNHDAGKQVGLDLYSGETINPGLAGIWDNYKVKRQMMSLAPALAEQLLLVDEIIKAGKQMGGQKN